MNEKFFCVDEINIGCLGIINYLGPGKGALWNKKQNPYIAFRKDSSVSLDDCHEGKNVFNNDKYYFLSEVSKKDNNLEIVQGKNVIGSSFPLRIVCGNGKDKISSIELKIIICNYNIADALRKKSDDDYLNSFKKYIDVIDQMVDSKEKERYVDTINDLLNDYINILSETSNEKRTFDIFVGNFNSFSLELEGKSKEKKRKKQR